MAETSEAVPSSTLEKGLLGQPVDDVERMFGKPDKVIPGKVEKSQSWYYGKSVVFFSEGLVIAWSDKGELESRREYKAVPSKKLESARDFRKRGWRNPWTPGKQLDPVNELDKIID